ncbi:hypothetical protein EGM88_01340 [Aureibaculum marinum]|uniref:Right-handed parallel beta-helix repeat-containing protein n=1 Tax=Aureibaculum marinum TaxID=2487930 RepID=A0A3N4P0G2_9FLAO|nr:hypothetical protein [Aureibaculum marinum]RPD99938.1 hypothetical protein EGM88_01340 [Aureibaculum marinum]
MRFLYSVFIVLIILAMGSCRKDFGTVISSGNLEFSVDTLLLNRVFDQIGSSTKSFKVYNRSNEAITIPNIKLGRGDDSFYRLNVDGVPGKSFENIDILPNDSIYVFVEATVDFDKVTDNDFFYRDSVVFYSGIKEQNVKLEALVLDVNLIRPDRVQQADGSFTYETIIIGENTEGNLLGFKGTNLVGNTTFTNEKPYLIYGYVGVPENTTLTIEEGATLYFHNNSGIIVDKNASLKVNGTFDNHVLFEDDRLEPEYENSPGQWGTIWLREGSKNNTINYAIIKNNVIGLLVDDNVNANPTLSIKNTQIYNTSNYGLLGRKTNILGENLVIANSGQSTLACTMGGIYNFTHSTFANYWNAGFRQFPSVLINNHYTYYDDTNTEIVETHNLQTANFTNCIISGNQDLEFLLDKVEGADFNFNIKNSMIKFNTTNVNVLESPIYDFDNTSLYQNIILNGEPNFMDVSTNEYIIGEESDANGNADIDGALQVPVDILNVNRTVSPDIGAYQHIVFEEEENS